MIGALIEQCRIHLGRRLVDEALAVEQGQDRLALRRRQGARRAGAGRGHRRRPGPLPIKTRPRHAEGAAGPGRADCLGQFAGAGHQPRSRGSGVARGSPKISESFFWAAMIASACRSRS